MSLFQCKICGKGLIIVKGSTTCECGYCGTKQPVPMHAIMRWQEEEERKKIEELRREQEEAERKRTEELRREQEEAERKRMEEFTRNQEAEWRDTKTFELNSDGKSYSFWSQSYFPPVEKILDTYNGLPITCIGNHAYAHCKQLKSIIIPNSVTNIGWAAFWDCEQLTSITIPDSVTSIGERAFSWCSSLTSVTIGNSVTSIGEDTFSSCTNLTSVTIGNSVTSIGRYAFYRCSSLTSITIPDSVTSIGHSAFYGCSNLTSATLPKNLKDRRYDDFMFSDCKNLKRIYCLGSFDNIENTVQRYIDIPMFASVFYYSEKRPPFFHRFHIYFSPNRPLPFARKRFWHYVDGVPTEW